MKVREFIDQHNLDSAVTPIFSSSLSLREKLDIDPFNFDLDPEQDRVSTILKPAKWLQGHEGVTHGGIVGTYLDSVSGVHAMLHALPIGKRAFTKKMTVQYVAPMLVEKEYQIVCETSGKNFICTISDDNTVIAKAELEFAFI